MAVTIMKIKPPVPVEILDLKNFVRLALALSDSHQIIWSMSNKGEKILALFTAYMYWDGDIPLLSFIRETNSKKPFLAYKSNSSNGEEYLFTESADDPRYVYASFIDVKKIPKPFRESIECKYPVLKKPMLVEVENLLSLIRILLSISVREDTNFPLWHFKRDGKHIVGICIPFEHYYEADAIPIFFYLKQNKPPSHPFIRYYASKSSGEKAEYVNNTSDSKFFYAKIISVKDFPIFS
jgi:hypothetical protein